MCTVHINKQILRARIFTFLVFFTLSYQKTVLKKHTQILKHTQTIISHHSSISSFILRLSFNEHAAGVSNFKL